jgi:putative endonuclease
MASSRLRPRQQLGRAGEQMARRTLEERGLQIIEGNYRCALGEMDLIAKCENTWVFVEVKTRRGNRFGTAADAVDARKQKKIMQVAETYLQEHGLSDADWRIDVVAIDMDSRGQLLGIEVIENAVSR